MRTFPAIVMAAMTCLCFHGNVSGRFAGRRRSTTRRTTGTGSIDSGSSSRCSEGTCHMRTILDNTVLDTSKVNMTALVNTTRVVICTGVTCALPSSAGCDTQHLFNNTLYNSPGDIPTVPPTNGTATVTSQKAHVCSSNPWKPTAGVPRTRSSIAKIGWAIAGGVVGLVILGACVFVLCSKKKK
ncbi:uncharacterized protein [Branchiostoma lanceolatum]|uniref:uncharacterized protein n=1 Tax=Branchiostoma lanceolatum TaxID=7740 RepID=UPI003453A881